MRNLILFVACVCVLLVAAPVFAQCPNGQCPSSAYPSVIPTPRVNVQVETANAAVEAYFLKYRNEQAAKDAAIADALRRLESAVNAKQAAPVVPAKPESPKEALKEKAEEVKDAVLESPFLRTLAVLVVLGLVLALGHAIYVKCHADKAKIDENLKDHPMLQSLFDKMDDFNTKFENKIHGVTTDQKTANSDLVKVALATPAPSQMTVAAPVVPAATPAVVPVAAPVPAAK